MNIVEHDVAVEKISSTLAQMYHSGHSESTEFTELTELLQNVMRHCQDQSLGFDEIIQKCDNILRNNL